MINLDQKIFTFRLFWGGIEATSSFPFPISCNNTCPGFPSLTPPIDVSPIGLASGKEWGLNTSQKCLATDYFSRIIYIFSCLLSVHFRMKVCFFPNISAVEIVSFSFWKALDSFCFFFRFGLEFCITSYPGFCNCIHNILMNISMPNKAAEIVTCFYFKNYSDSDWLAHIISFTRKQYLLNMSSHSLTQLHMLLITAIHSDRKRCKNHKNKYSSEMNFEKFFYSQLFPSWEIM